MDRKEILSAFDDLYAQLSAADTRMIELLELDPRLAPLSEKLFALFGEVEDLYRDNELYPEGLEDWSAEREEEEEDRSDWLYDSRRDDEMMGVR